MSGMHRCAYTQQISSPQRLRWLRNILPLALLALTATSHAQTSLTTLYDFTGSKGDGASPLGDLVADSTGTLYGTTAPGGRRAQVYKLTPPAVSTSAWSKATLYSATPGNPVLGNLTPVILGKHGELYGASDSCPGIPFGCVFQLMPPASSGGAWIMNVIHGFQGSAQGDGKGVALGKLAIDSKGKLYGVTQMGGVADTMVAGTVYQLTPPATTGGSWAERILYKFRNVRGSFYFPQMSVTIGKNGALYGSTRFSNDLKTGNRAPGVIYQLSLKAGVWTMTVINGAIGGNGVLQPGTSQLTVAGNGTVYGVSTLAGGAFALLPPASSGGTWTLIRLPSNTAGGPGWELGLDPTGNLYGTDQTNQRAYKLTPPATAGGSWTYSLLHTFVGGSEGVVPFGRPLINSAGSVFGTTEAGGPGNCMNFPLQHPGCGVVFELQ